MYWFMSFITSNEGEHMLKFTRWGGGGGRDEWGWGVLAHVECQSVAN